MPFLRASQQKRPFGKNQKTWWLHIEKGCFGKIIQQNGFPLSTAKAHDVTVPVKMVMPIQAVSI
jgi:hypothetical protein